MAVQQRKSTASRRGMRRSHDALSTTNVATDRDTGEAHYRHHISPNGFYRGRLVFKKKVPKKERENDSQSEV